ncbi:MAG: nitrilase-related carbon-nitrogen hydrolase [Thermodesulfobacteriota bacterium]
MKAAFMQTSPEFGEVEKNVDSVVRKIALRSSEGIGLVVLPEFFSTGYQFKTKAEARELAEKAPDGYTTRRLIEVAKKTWTHIVFGMAEIDGKNLYNSAVLVGPKGFIGTYRKAHLFWNEKKIFTPGNMPFKVYDIGTAKVGMMICFDWLFPEAARRLALLGADIIAHPSNLVLPHCPKAMITRCLENRVFSITANRVGREARIKGVRLTFIGQSQVVSPKGEVLCHAGRMRPEFKIIEINPKEARDKKITPLNDIFADRRVELY